MQNEPKLPCFQPKNNDFTKKRTQNKAKQSQIAKYPKSTYTLYCQSVMRKYDYLTEMKTNPNQSQTYTVWAIWGIYNYRKLCGLCVLCGKKILVFSVAKNSNR